MLEQQARHDPEAVLHDVLPGGLLEPRDLGGDVDVDHLRVVPVRLLQRRRDDVLAHRVEVVRDGVAGARLPHRGEAFVGAPAHQHRVTGQSQLRLDLSGPLVAGTAERRPQVRPLDDAVDGDVGRVDDLAHGPRAFHELELRIRSDLVLLERTNPRPPGDVLVHLTRDSGVALHRQIEASIRGAIRAGRLPRGTSLPPTRTLADELGVSRGVVVEAYQQLIAEGYLTSRAGGYTRVAIAPEVPAGEPPPLPAAGAGIDFCP